MVNWSVWLILLGSTTSLLLMGSLLASIYFFVGFYIEHQITENMITGQPSVVGNRSRHTQWRANLSA